MDDGRCLDFQGSKRVSYAELSSVGEKMTVCVRISGAPEYKIEPALIVFKNQKRSYPIRGVPDNIDGVAYRSQPKGWIDQNLFPEYFKETKIIEALPDEENGLFS